AAGEDVCDGVVAGQILLAERRVPAQPGGDDRHVAEDPHVYVARDERARVDLVERGEPLVLRDVRADAAGAREHEVVGEELAGRRRVPRLHDPRPLRLQLGELAHSRSRNLRTAVWASSPSIESASQSRAWPTVS